MTRFQPNITDSIDNLNQAEKNIEKLQLLFDKVYVDAPEKIDSMLENNIETKSGSSLTINNTVDNGKFDWTLQGACEQDTISGKNKVDYDGTQVTLIKSTARTATITPTNFPLTLPAETYTINIPDYVMTNHNNSYSPGIQMIKSGGGNVNTNFDLDNKSGTFTIAESTSFSGLYFFIHNNDNDDATVTFSKIMLVDGSTAGEYEPYTGGIPSPNPDYPQNIRVVTGNNSVVVSDENNVHTQTATLNLGTEYLAGIEDYKDVIVGKTDNWKIVRNIGKEIFNGTQQWAGSGDFYYYTLNDAMGTNSARPKSNRFKYGGSSADYGIIRFGNTNQNLIFNKSRTKYPNVNDWNTYFSNNNTEVYYELATTTETPITDTTLISDLNDLYKDAVAYKDKTLITTSPDTGNAVMKLSVNAFVTEKEE